VRHYAQVAPKPLPAAAGRDYWQLATGDDTCAARAKATATAKQQHRFTVKTFLQLAASAASLHMKLQMYAGGGEKKDGLCEQFPFIVHRSPGAG